MLLLIGSAHAQTYTNLYSPWFPWDPRLKYVGTMSLLDASGAEVNKTALNSIFNNVTVVFPVQVLGTTVPKVRVVINGIGTNAQGVADLDSSITLNYLLSPAYVAVAGSNPTFVYAPMSFSPTLVASAPMPVLVPPPLPAPGLSPDGTLVLGPNGSLVTTAGTWTFGPVAGPAWLIFLNGKQAADGAGMALLYKGGAVYTRYGTTWYKWGNGWTQVPAP
jgi:hypothetical protein